MKIPAIATFLALLLSMAGVADAAPAAGSRDDSFETIDLTPIEGAVFYIMCANYEDQPKSIFACERPSIWQEINDHGGLQSTAYSVPGKTYPQDQELLG